MPSELRASLQPETMQSSIRTLFGLASATRHDPIGGTATDHGGAAADNDASITISRVEYQELSQIARLHANLLQYLLGMGIDEETLDYMCSGQAHPQGDSDGGSEFYGSVVSDALRSDVPSPVVFDFQDSVIPSPVVSGSFGSVPLSLGRFPSSLLPSSAVTSPHVFTSPPATTKQRKSHTGKAMASSPLTQSDEVFVRPRSSQGSGQLSRLPPPARMPSFYATQAPLPSPARASSLSSIQDPPTETVPNPCQTIELRAERSIILYKLPRGVRHGDITGVIRGGMILDLFLHAGATSAMVSFVYASDAQAFFNHCMGHGLHIRNKRVDIKWAERHFYIPGPALHRIRRGATRNLIVRRADLSLTEQTVREDLEHIHKLFIIRVEFSDGNCIIRTNSINHAVAARDCMVTQRKYKSSNIGWVPDECAQPFECTQHLKRAQPCERRRSSGRSFRSGPTKSASANRFGVLSNAGEDEEEYEVYEGGPGSTHRY